MQFILNFHGIGHAKRPYEDNEQPYWVDEGYFCQILDFIQSQKSQIGITFDDGNDSDYLIAAPELRKRGLGAEFFILAGKLGQMGYLNSDQVMALDQDPSFAIGSHGMDHRPWTELDTDALHYEVTHSQSILSEICGRTIDTVGLPFGRYNRTVIQKLNKVNYRKIYSSDGGARLTGANPIARYSIRNDLAIDSLANMIKTYERMASRIKSEALATLKSMH